MQTRRDRPQARPAEPGRRARGGAAPDGQALPINVADLVVIVVLLLSGLFAFLRGLVHEVLAVAAWVGAALVTLYGFTVRPMRAHLIAIPLVADSVAGSWVFLVALIVFSMISHGGPEAGAGAQPGRARPLARLRVRPARGALIVCLAWLLLHG